MSKSYFVHYVKNSSPTLKKFNSKTSTVKFYDDLAAKASNDAGDWVDFLLEGNILNADAYYAEHIKTKTKASAKKATKSAKKSK